MDFSSFTLGRSFSRRDEEDAKSDGLLDQSKFLILLLVMYFYMICSISNQLCIY